MKKVHKIVMLPTEDNSKLYHHKREKRLGYWFKGTKPNYAEFQHLYILSDDEIKGDCWYYDSNVNKVYNTGGAEYGDTKNIFKIIATTDTKLVTDNCLEPTCDTFDCNDCIGKEHLPQIPQSLVEYYVKHQPDEVELEYEKVNWEHTNCEGVQFGVYEELKLKENEVVWVETERCNCPPWVAM